MKSLFIEGKQNSPAVAFSEGGVLSIVGRSIPEHPLKFYKPLEDWITEFLATSPIKVYFKVHLDYLNTHSTECMLTLMKKIEEYATSSKADVSILWNFDEDDEDMQTLGEDLKSLVKVPFKIEEAKS
ncbi:MAG: DUF1987 domain-containing protein [Flavobacteriales bacterium]|nr:DUF1987 domain-containing protein [Flavobacteriales bacterium]MCB9173832.1 DUF1987 domain-containing protein [Flavobacteriales bacterium]